MYLPGIPGAAPSMALSNQNAPGFSRMFTDPNAEPRMPPICPSADAAMQGGTFTSIDDVVGGLRLPDRVRDQLHKGLSSCGKGPDATMNAITGPLRELRKETGDHHLVAEIGKRFAAYLGNGLYKSGGAPAGFSPIPGSAHGGYHKKVGAGWQYFYPGVGVTRQSREGEPGGQAGTTRPKPQSQGAASGARTMPTVQGAQGLAGDAWQDPNAHKPLSETLGHEPHEFNGLSKVERARKTAHWADLADDLSQHGSPNQYGTHDHSTVHGSAVGHIRQLVADGTFSHDDAARTIKISERMAADAKAAGVEPHLLADLMHRNIQKIGLQTQKTHERTLGDHGIRHIAVNIESSHAILDALKAGGMPVEPMDYLSAAQVMIDHDLGYTIPAIHGGGSAIKDDYHPQASRALWEQQPEMARIFGREGWAEMGRLIESHSGSDLDWEQDPMGSAVRLADNTHLFADKLPEVIYDSRKGVELMAKIALLKQAGASSPEAIDALKGALMKHIEGRTDIAMSQRHRLLIAAKEIGPRTPDFLASRLAGRAPTFTFDPTSKSMTVNIEHSAARGAVSDVFGPDDEDKQFSKLLSDFGVSREEQAKIDAPPPAVRIDIPPTGAKQASFIWSEGAGAAGGSGAESDSSSKEQQFAEIMRQTQAEYQGIQALPPDQQAEKMRLWTSELTKSRNAVPVIRI